MYISVIIFALWVTVTIFLLVMVAKTHVALSIIIKRLYKSEKILMFLVNDKEIRDFLQDKNLVFIKPNGDEFDVIWKNY